MRELLRYWDTSIAAVSFRSSTGISIFLGVLLSASMISARDDAERTKPTPPAFRTEIQPILAAYCVKCHGPEKQKGGLRLDQRAAAFKGGDSEEPGIVPRQSAQSRLFQLVSSTDDSEWMPPSGDRLTQAQIDLLRRWIDADANWPEAESRPAQAGRSEMIVTAEDRQHWSFRPLRAVEPPTVKTAGWVRSPVDTFIMAALEARQLSPTPMADPRKLIRRVYFDMIGLPPTPDEVNAFCDAAARNPQSALEALVDRLLDSRHHGERWARHWLDVMRYADSDGMEEDFDRPNAYHYRDFVIRSLNDDLPFDTFVKWQIAGDELEPDNPLAVAATGFLAAGPRSILSDKHLEEERLFNRYNDLDDILSTLGTGMFGLTLGCARCHDHKYDPIPARDYYRLMAALHSGDRADVPLGAPAEIEAYKKRHAAWQQEVKAAEENLKSLPQAMNDDQRRMRDELTKAVADARSREPAAPPSGFVYKDLVAEPQPTWLFRRGNFRDREIPVTLGFLSVLTNGRSPDEYWQTARAERLTPDSTYQRKALAEWMVDVEHGAGALVARVIVNRVWQHHFGTGLVATVNDFGGQGERPSHPELLEWLTNDFVAHGWKLKRLHRLILTSAAWQQGTAFDAEKAQADPDNRLLSRRRPQRLEAEILRDSMLAVSGSLNLEPYGPGFKPPISAEAMTGRNVKDPYPTNVKDSPAVRRRSVYMFHKRLTPSPLLQAFDKPEAQQGCGRRDNTTVAPQALAMLNDQFVRDRAFDFADRLLAVRGDETGRWVEAGYQLALSRPPHDVERAASVAFIESQILSRGKRDAKAAPVQVQRDALADFCQALFSLNEFIYVD